MDGKIEITQIEFSWVFSGNEWDKNKHITIALHSNHNEAISIRCDTTSYYGWTNKERAKEQWSQKTNEILSNELILKCDIKPWLSKIEDMHLVFCAKARGSWRELIGKFVIHPDTDVFNIGSVEYDKTITAPGPKHINAIRVKIGQYIDSDHEKVTDIALRFNYIDPRYKNEIGLNIEWKGYGLIDWDDKKIKAYWNKQISMYLRGIKHEKYIVPKSFKKKLLDSWASAKSDCKFFIRDLTNTQPTL